MRIPVEVNGIAVRSQRAFIADEIVVHVVTRFVARGSTNDITETLQHRRETHREYADSSRSQRHRRKKSTSLHRRRNSSPCCNALCCARKHERYHRDSSTPPGR